MARCHFDLRQRVPILTTALLTSLTPAAFAAIPLNSPTTDWYAIEYATNRSDYINDQQTGDAEGDLVGTVNGDTPLQTAFYFDYDTTLIGFRVRVDADSNPAGYTGAVWVGLMLDAGDSIDLFAGVINKGPDNEIGFYNPGTDLNTSPSTTSIEDDTPIYSETISASNYLFTAVTVGPTGNDPVVGGTND
jgi:hypothetical protein